ncbi:hypothetical protein [Carboxylicivirga caseinilyticus]|uniref:hypothetical protein n=1 Tax=Carboxylicivirga caseinilyticus TaxID=3417572 RepID=UPI003D3443CE|nr:hypothetical protein [Marinilabiliaceae bacterium A049]
MCANHQPASGNRLTIKSKPLIICIIFVSVESTALPIPCVIIATSGSDQPFEGKPQLIPVGPVITGGITMPFGHLYNGFR